MRTIVAGILLYRPDRLFTFGFVACLLLMTVLGTYPVEFYLHHRAVEEWMIYRFMAGFLLGSSGFLLLCAIALSHEMARLGPMHRRTDSFWSTAISRLFQGRGMLIFVGALRLDRHRAALAGDRGIRDFRQVQPALVSFGGRHFSVCWPPSRPW